MVYKPTAKDYLLIVLRTGVRLGLLFGLGDGLVSLFIFRDSLSNIGFFLIAISLVCGLLFGAFLGGFSALNNFNVQKRSEREIQPLRAGLATARPIVCEGGASLMQGKTAIGGWLFLTESALEFYPHKYNKSQGTNTAILLDDITAVRTQKNNLLVDTAQEAYTFVVSCSNLWEADLKRTI